MYQHAQFNFLGHRMLKTSFSPWPSFTDEEAQAVKDVILSNKVNYWTGQECRQFETEFAEYFEAQHAIALANGTVAIDLALKALGIGEGDEVIVTPRTFIATVSSIIVAGATPIFADVDRDSQNITDETISKVITGRTRAIICVHLAGWPCDMDPIVKLSKEKNIYIIEDCAQAHGARYKDRPVGTIGDIGCWSFCQDKIITTGGEGGMVTTNNNDLWKTMWSFKDHGKNWDKVNAPSNGDGFKWLHDSFGTNWRMTEMQAAIGRIQLNRLYGWSRKRLNNAERIWRTAKKLEGLRVPKFIYKNDTEFFSVHAAYKCYVFVDGDEKLRNTIIQELNSGGVPCYSGSCSEVYLEKAFDNTGWRPKTRLPVAKELGETSLMFLIHPTLTDAEINKTCSVLKYVMDLKHVKKLVNSSNGVLVSGRN